MQKKLALVGCGAWGAKIARTIETSKSLALQAVATSKTQGELQQNLPGFRGKVLRDYRDLGELVTAVDGVVIATPPHGRERIIDFFLEQAVPVLTEKPMTLSAGATAALVAKARSANVLLVENFVHVYSWAYQAIRQRISASRPLEVESIGMNSGPFRDYSPIHDYGPHDLSLTLQIFGGEPKAFEVQTFLHHGERRFCTRVQMDFGLRGKASLVFGNTSPVKVRSLVCRAGGETWQYDDTRPEKLFLNDKPHRDTRNPSSLSPIELSLLNFTGIEQIYSAEESLWLSETVGALTEEIARKAGLGGY